MTQGPRLFDDRRTADNNKKTKMFIDPRVIKTSKYLQQK